MNPCAKTESSRNFMTFRAELAAAQEILAQEPSKRNKLALKLHLAHVAGKSPLDPEKARNFLALAQAGFYDPHTPLPLLLGNEDPLFGIEPPTDRPVEFAIGQFLASNASPFWEKPIVWLANQDSWKPCFEQPMAFKILRVVRSEDEDEVPFTHFDPTPCLASVYLRREADRNESAFGKKFCLELAGKIEAVISPKAQEKAMLDNFMIQAFGALPVAAKTAKAKA